MKSQRMKIRNLDHDRKKMKTIHVKPTPALAIMLVMGVALMVMKSYMLLAGLAMVLLALFALTVMPDRNLCSFCPEYLVLYNCRDKAECMVIYWEDIVNWQYEWSPVVDHFAVTLVDGHTEIQEVYAKGRIQRAMNHYAPGKEKKVR